MPEKLTSPKLPTRKCAEISTAHITRSDGKLLSHPQAPYHVANTKGGFGSFYYVPDEDPARVLRDFGFSPAVRRIFRRARKQGIALLRFDADAPTVRGLPVFDW